MFSKWKSQEKLKTALLPPWSYTPYPTAQDRGSWNKLGDNVRKELILQAETYLEFQWPSLPAMVFMEFYQDGNRTGYEEPHFLRRRALTALVLGECAEGKRRFLPDIINGIWSLCEESFWGVPAHNGVSEDLTDSLPDVENHYIDLFAAETAGLLVWTKFLLEEELGKFSQRLLRRIDVELEQRIKKPFLEREDFWWMGYRNKAVNNWTPWILSNVTSVFLLGECDVMRRAQGIEKVLVILPKFLAEYGEDGGCDEGTTYWAWAGGTLFDTLDQLYHGSGGALDFFHEPLIQNIGRFMVNSHIADDYFINFADGAARVEVDKGLLYRYGRRVGDRDMMNLAYSVPTFDAKDRVPQGLHRALSDLFQCPVSIPKSMSPPLLRDVWMKNLQVMAARETQGSAEGLYLAAKGGHNNESHNHNDIGSCIISLDGMPALIDIGVESYTKKTFSDERYSIWTMQSQFHNIPTINHTMQAHGAEFRGTQVLYEKKSNAVDFALDIHTAYPPEAKVESYRRHYHLERGLVPYITIQDTFSLEEQGLIEFNFMCWQKPELLQDGLLSLPVGKETKHRELLLEYPKNTLTFRVQHMNTEDERLYPIWGDIGVHRIQLTLEKAPRKGEILFTIKAKPEK